MNDQEAAEAVLRWATQAHTDAVYQYAKARAEVQANHAGREAWDGYNPNDGVGCAGTNPYSRNTEHLSRAADSTLERQNERAHIQDFVIRRICGLIYNTSGAAADPAAEPRVHKSHVV